MPKTRSVRGELVDFDLLRTKQKIEDRKKPDDVTMRERYIDIKRRRRNPYRSVADLVDQQKKNEEEVRSKVRQQKVDKEAAVNNSEEPVSTEMSPTPEASPTPTKTTRRTSKKTIVKRTTKSDSE